MGQCHFLFISFVELDDGLYTLAEYVERHVLVGRVDGIALKSEAHQHRLYAQYALKVAYDRYASAAAHCQGLLAEGLLKSPFQLPYMPACLSGTRSPRRRAWA